EGKIEDAIADVMLRLYLAPARGLAAEAKLRTRLEKLTGELSNVLVAEAAQAIDFGERPQLADLDKDYGHAAARLTRSISETAIAALDAAMEARGGQREKIRKIAEALAASDVIPEAVQKRAQKTVVALADRTADDVVIDREARGLVTVLKKERG